MRIEGINFKCRVKLPLVSLTVAEAEELRAMSEKDRPAHLAWMRERQNHQAANVSIAELLENTFKAGFKAGRRK